MTTVDHWLDVIGKPISVSRWGDGESLILSGAEGANCDGVKYTAPLRAMLAEAAQNEAVIKLTTRDKAWKFPFESQGDHATLHDASERGNVRPFFSAIRAHGNITIVGPQHLRNLPLKFAHVVTHPSDAIDHLQDLLKQLDHIGPGDLVLFCAGPTSNVLIDRLHGRGACLLDVGALLDPYAGVISRIHQRRARIDLSQMSPPIMVAMATQPHRDQFAKRVIGGMRHQPWDSLQIAFNGYDEAPQWAKDFQASQKKPVTFVVGENLGARMKFHGVEHFDGQLVTIDDDIYYPLNYVKQITQAQRTVKGVVGYHGAINKVEYWDKHTEKIHFADTLRKNKRVNVLGTGTMCINTAEMHGLSFADFAEHANFTDPFMAGWCFDHGIKMTALQRSKGWLKSMDGSQDSGKELWRQLFEKKKKAQYVRDWSKMVPA
jgi:hypothetical protein